MKIIKAGMMGLCSGVKRALNTVEQIPDPKDVTVLGELVHNEDIMSNVRSKGFVIRTNSETSPISTKTVLIPAHGISGAERSKIQEKGKKIIDTTCPLVKNVRDTAKKLHGENHFIIIIGQAEHVEVKGITGDLQNFVVVGHREDITNYKKNKIAILSQTTSLVGETVEMYKEIIDKNPEADIKFLDTICSSTIKRQEALESLLPEINILLVVGGKNSNNTLQMVKVGKNFGVRTYHIQNAGDIQQEWFTKSSKVGLTAGASTPDQVIEEVYLKLSAIADVKDTDMNTENSPSNIVTKAGIIAGVSFILGLLFDHFFYQKNLGVSFPSYVVLITTGLFSMASFSKKTINKEVVWLLAPLLFFSTMVFVRSSGLLTFLNVTASLLLLLAIAKVTFYGGIKNYFIGDYIRILSIPFKFMRPLSQTLSDLSSLRSVYKDKKTLLQVARGIAMALFVLFIFALLFSSADLVFRKYFWSLLDFGISPEAFSRAMQILIATFVFIGAYSYTFRKIERQNYVPRNKTYSIGYIESSILLSSVNVLFFIFILVQLTYLFGGEGSISTQGFTYAEYARRGFFELIAVAIISLLLLLTAEKYSIRKESGHSLVFKIVSAILVIQVIIIMGSAFIRLSLYEKAYGFTTLRLYSHTFLILLAVIFCLLLYKIYKDKKENVFAFGTFISIVLFLAAMNFLNPDAFIARRNIEQFAATGKIDLAYLSNLSDDAIAETVGIIGLLDEDMRKSFYRKLYRRWHATYNDPHYSKWQSLNMSRMRAATILNSNYEPVQ